MSRRVVALHYDRKPFNDAQGEEVAVRGTIRIRW